MHKRPRFLGVIAIMAILFSGSNTVGADDEYTIAPYGIGVTPAVYLVNFMVMYMASPDDAANMPAYRAPLPLSLADCLHEFPEGCPYTEFAQTFDDRPFTGSTNQTKKCAFPPVCTTKPNLEKLAPSVVVRSNQINEPLGLERANQIAEELGITKDIILTDEEWECTLGRAPRNDDRKIIYACLNNLTNSIGNTNIPLSSYGLAITRAELDGEPGLPLIDKGGDVQSLCAPEAPCLEFNDLFTGPLERIAAVCKWEDKLIGLFALDSFQQVISDGKNCQDTSIALSAECLVEPVCDY
jgi:hypothetical protein